MLSNFISFDGVVFVYLSLIFIGSRGWFSCDTTVLRVRSNHGIIWIRFALIQTRTEFLLSFP